MMFGTDVVILYTRVEALKDIIKTQELKFTKFGNPIIKEGSIDELEKMGYKFLHKNEIIKPDKQTIVYENIETHYLHYGEPWCIYCEEPHSMMYCAVAAVREIRDRDYDNYD